MGSRDPLRNLGTIARRILVEQKGRQQNPEKYKPLKTGLTGLDFALDGWEKRWYWGIGGKPKEGKSTTLKHLAMMASAQGLKVDYFILEEKKKQLAIRAMVKMSTRVERSDFRNLRITDEGFEELEGIVTELEELDIQVFDEVFFAEQIYKYLKELSPEDRPDILAIDYTQLFHDHMSKSMAERADAISAIFMRIRNEFDVGMLVAFQLGIEKDRQYGGSSIARDADIIMHVSKVQDSTTKKDIEGLLQIAIQPSREAMETKFNVAFSGAHSRLQDEAPVIPEVLLDPKAVMEMEKFDDYDR